MTLAWIAPKRRGAEGRSGRTGVKKRMTTKTAIARNRGCDRAETTTGHPSLPITWPLTLPVPVQTICFRTVLAFHISTEPHICMRKAMASPMPIQSAATQTATYSQSSAMRVRTRARAQAMMKARAAAMTAGRWRAPRRPLSSAKILRKSSW